MIPRRCARWLVSALLVHCAAPTVLAAQSDPRVRVAVSGTLADTRRSSPDGVEELSGLLFGGAGALAWGPVRVRAGYSEGALQPAMAGGTSSTYVEAYFLLGSAVLPDLSIAAGPHARAYLTDGVADRWLSWELRARYEAPIIDRVVRGFVEAWGAVTGEGARPQAFDGGWGGAAGIGICPAGLPFGAWLDYALDETRFGGGARRERVERVALSLGYGCR